MVADEYYNDYLSEKLELVFNGNGNVVFENFLMKNKKKSNVVVKENTNYNIAKEISLDEFLDIFPYIEKESIYLYRPQAIKLDNGIVGVRVKTGWYFPHFNITLDCDIDHFRYFKNGFFSIGHFLFDPNGQLIYKATKTNQQSGCFDKYNNKHFIYTPDDENDTKKLIDFKGKVFIEDNSYTTIIKDQCYYEHEKTSHFLGEKMTSYKVTLKSGDPFCNGTPQRFIKSLNGCEIFSSTPDFIRCSDTMVCGRNLRVIPKNGVPLEHGKTYEKVSLLNDKYIAAGNLYESMIYDIYGKKVSFLKFSNVEEYGKDKIKCRSTEGNEFIILEDGSFFSQKGYEKINLIDDDYATVKENNKYYIIGREGNKIHCNGIIPYKSVFRYNTIFTLGNKNIVVKKTKQLKEANVRKKLFGGYTCTYKGENINIKYKPVMFYGNTNVLCINNKKQLYIYNVAKDEYELLGDLTDVHYNNFMIEANGKILFSYKDKLLDITNFYKRRLSYLDKIKFNKDIGEILTDEEFKEQYKDELQLLQAKSDYEQFQREEKQRETKKIMAKKISKEKQKNAEILAKQRQKKEIIDGIAKKKEENARIEEGIENCIKQFHEVYKEYREYKNARDPNNKDSLPLLNPDGIFVTCGDHKEIHKDFENYLDMFDLSNQTFENVKVAGLNFEGSNARFNPQVVYQKDLSNCNLNGIFFSPFTDFTGVKLYGATLSYDNDDRTIDMFNSSIKKSFCDENTKINGKTVEEFFNEEKHDDVYQKKLVPMLPRR